MYPDKRNIRLLSAIVAVCLLTGGSLFLFSPEGAALEDLSSEEKRQLSHLLDLMLAVDRSAQEKDDLEKSVDQIQTRLDELKEIQSRAREEFLETRARVVASLRWLHRTGPTSYLEILLGASSLRDFLRRAEIALSAARGAVRSLRDVQRERQEILQMQTEIEELETAREELKRDLEALLEVHREMEQEEARLEKIWGEDWSKIGAEVGRLRELWHSQARPYLEELPAAFSRLARADMDPSGLIIQPSLFSVRVIIPATSLNDLLSTEALLRDTVFRFSPGEAQLVDLASEIQTRGTLAIDSRGILTYRVSAVELGGIPVNQRHLTGLFDRVDLDLSPLLQGLSPRSITVLDGAVELIMSFSR